MTYACDPEGCRYLKPPTWYQLWSFKDSPVTGELYWVGWLYSDPAGVRMVADDQYRSYVSIFDVKKHQIPGVDYSRARYPFGPRWYDSSEGQKQWFRVVTWPFVMMGGWAPPMHAVGWIWTSPYKVKKFLVGKGSYKIYWADGREITFTEAIH